MSILTEHQQQDKPESPPDVGAGEFIWSTGNPKDDAILLAQIDARYAGLHAFGCAFASFLRRREAGR
jgi:hypothetical protein